MRTETEMYDLILDIAKNDARIKAVYMGWTYHQEEGRAARSYLESVYQMAKDR